MGKQSAPPTPDYAGAARETAAGNLDAARATTAANRVNQITPEGSLTYEQTGQDPFGNPMWTGTQTYSPDQQQIYQGNVDLSKGLLGTAQQGLSYVDEQMRDPSIDKSQLPTFPVGAGHSYIDAARELQNPQWERKQDRLGNQLANQGITMGSEAYTGAMDDLSRQRTMEDAQLTMGGMDKSMNAYQQALTNQQYEKMQPLNIVNALRTGNQVSGPNYVAPYNQNAVAGPDLLGAANAKYQGDLAGVNANNAATGGITSGLFGLGSAWLGA